MKASFADIDECTVGRPCDQICTNDIGSFQCSCNDGYKLQSDGVNCSGKIQCNHVKVIL